MARDVARHYAIIMCILVVTPGIVYNFIVYLYACNIDVLGPMCKLWICHSVATAHIAGPKV
jgi:hypothetical protein